MEIKKSNYIDGLGLFVNTSYTKDDIIFVLDGDMLDYPTRESIHIGNNKHIIDKFGSFINHSFNPNIKIDGKNVVALKKIKIGEEICFNYNDSEINMACPFHVNHQIVCGKLI